MWYLIVLLMISITGSQNGFSILGKVYYLGNNCIKCVLDNFFGDLIEENMYWPPAVW